MTPVHRYDPVALCLTEAYMPYMVCTAEKAFMHLLKDTAVGLAVDGSRITFESMRTGRVDAVEDQPVMRSSHHTWVLPTILVARKKAFYDRKRKTEDNLPPIREVYDYFKGTCQHCGKKIKWRDASADKRASREHVLAVSLGGSDHRFNLLLMHALCNQKLGNAPIKYDIDGNVLSGGMKPRGNHFQLPAGMKARPEWINTCPWLAETPHLELT